MKSNITLIALAVATLSSGAVFAQAKAPTPEFTVTGNAGLFTDYRFRGISQTNKKPAFQGGFDVAHASGLYLGNWNSNIDANFFAGSNLEMDIYGGYKGTAGGIAYDVGVLHYYYPGSGSLPGTGKIKNTEVYFGGTVGSFSAKYYHAVSDFFSLPDTKNSYYIDLAYTYDLGGGTALNTHVGYQKVKRGAAAAYAAPSLVDYKLGLTHDIAGSGYVAGLAYVTTNKKDAAFSATKKLANGSVVASLSKTF